MSTYQLTTEQVIILDIIDCLERYDDEGFEGAELEDKLSAFSWDCVDIDPECVDENIELLEHFKYLYADKTLTYEGKQYLKISKEYAKRKEKQTSFLSIDKFVILDIEKLGVIFDVTSGLADSFKVFKTKAGKLGITIRDKISKERQRKHFNKKK